MTCFLSLDENIQKGTTWDFPGMLYRKIYSIVYSAPRCAAGLCSALLMGTLLYSLTYSTPLYSLLYFYVSFMNPLHATPNYPRIFVLENIPLLAALPDMVLQQRYTYHLIEPCLHISIATNPFPHARISIGHIRVLGDERLDSTLKVVTPDRSRHTTYNISTKPRKHKKAMVV